MAFLADGLSESAIAANVFRRPQHPGAVFAEVERLKEAAKAGGGIGGWFSNRWNDVTLIGGNFNVITYGQAWYTGIGHGYVMIGNTFTFGQITSLNDYTNGLIAENGGGYSVANGSTYVALARPLSGPRRLGSETWSMSRWRRRGDCPRRPGRRQPSSGRAKNLSDDSDCGGRSTCT